MRRGEIWWADLGEPIGRRPVLVLTRNDGIRIRSNITVAPITTRIRGIPTEVALGPADGLPRECVADLDSLQTLQKRTLIERQTSLSLSKLYEAEAAIRFALDL
ncbi:MAG TPA: type II toxin-antitoxin system PemK/MazF family toxin [Chthonomonadales bacterium]|nr:type II toxin-antitoxin system PemK/MazF family toxin [Chthonomonadales bacterium]